MATSKLISLYHSLGQLYHIPICLCREGIMNNKETALLIRIVAAIIIFVKKLKK